MASVNSQNTPTLREGLVGLFTDFIEFSSEGNADVVRITPQVREILRRSGLSEGTLTVFAPGATAAVTTIEFEPGVVTDLQSVLDTIARSPASGLALIGPSPGPRRGARAAARRSRRRRPPASDRG